MALWDKVKGQLRSVIQWENPTEGDLFYRWTENGDEIKNASKLIVGPGQGAIFVYEGEVKEVITEEGIIDLETANIPFWTTITKFMQAFESEHKVGIYFFKTTKIVDQKWGTPSIIKYQDPTYNFPVGLRAFGNFTFQIKDPGGFFVNVTGAVETYGVDDFRQVMASRFVQPLTDYFAEAKLSYADIDAERNEIAAGLTENLQKDFDKLGFTLTDFRIEGTNFDEDTMKRINRIADMSAEAQAAKAAGIDYSQMQQLEAMREAARNEGGGAGMGMGLGAGMGFGNMMAGAMAQNYQTPPAGQQPPQAGQAPPAAPAPAPAAAPAAAAADPMAKLQQLKQMLDGELISQAEYDTKKKDILSQM
ncbi:MAG: SPFH domain-containing protein [Leptospirales bacterium]